MPKFCFLLPAYKSSFLRETLSSILNQEYDDFSLVVSDDCSPEPVAGVVAQLNSDPRLSYSRTSHNIGAESLVIHWNLLLSRCESDYVIIAGDDDVYDSRFLLEINRLTELYPDNDLYSTGLNTIDAQGAVTHSYTSNVGLMSLDSFVRHFLDPQAILCMGNYVFRTKALKEKGGFVQFPMAWKSDSASQILMALGSVAVSPEVLFSFRMSGQNLSARTEPNSSREIMKLRSVLLFDRWASDNCYPHIDQELKNMMRHRLEGELRMYMWTIPLTSKLRVFLRLRRENWFISFRNEISFLYCCVKSIYGRLE